MLYPVDNQSVPAETRRTLAAAWPDRFYALNEIEVQGKKAAVSTWLHRPQLTVMSGTQEFQLPNRTESEQVMAVDATAQHWMALLLPPTDPKAVVYDLQQQTVNQKPAHTLKLALGTLPIFDLAFDAATDTLVRVEYVTSEAGVRRRKQWTAVTSTPGPHGLVLPNKTECRHDNVVVEEWAVEKWEFPETIKEAEFNPPAK